MKARTDSAAPPQTVSSILDEYAKDCIPSLSRRTQKDYLRHLAALKERFGPRKAVDLSRKDFVDFMNVGRGRHQRNRMLSVLSESFNHAVDQGWLNSNVCKEVQRNKATSRNRYITDDEFEGMLQLTRPKVRAAMRLALHTGQRQGDIINLKWSQVDANAIHFEQGLERSAVDVPITPELSGVLDECRRLSKGSEYVVATRTGERYTSEGFRAVWQRQIKKWLRAGGKHFTFQDIRTKWYTDRQSFVVPPEVQTLIDTPQETLRVELKGWVDLHDQVMRAKIAKALAAIANHGGGYLIFGFQKNGEPSENQSINLATFNHDTFAGIIDKYLTPTFHCEVFSARPKNGVNDCIVVRIPGHGSVPICAKSNGPHDSHGTPQAIRMGHYYIRVPGPKSVAIETPDQWRAVIHRCVINEREFLLRGIGDLLRAPEAKVTASAEEHQTQ